MSTLQPDPSHYYNGILLKIEQDNHILTSLTIGPEMLLSSAPSSGAFNVGDNFSRLGNGIGTNTHLKRLDQ